MLVNNNKNHHVHVLKDSTQTFGNVKNVLLDGEMTDNSTISTVTTTSMLEDSVNTKLVLKLQDALSVKSKEVQKIAIHVFQELKTNADVLKDSTMLSGNAKNVLSVSSETHKPTNVLQLHHVTPQAKLEEVQKHAMLVHNNKNHHVHVHKDSIQIFGNVKNVLSDGEMTEISTI